MEVKLNGVERLGAKAPTTQFQCGGFALPSHHQIALRLAVRMSGKRLMQFPGSAIRQVLRREPPSRGLAHAKDWAGNRLEWSPC